MRIKLSVSLLLISCLMLQAQDSKEMKKKGEVNKEECEALPTAKNRKEYIAQMKAMEARTPKAGQDAPDFTLKGIDGKTSFTLSSMKGKKPVVLIFGSYT